VEQLRGLIVNSDSSVPLRLSDVAEIDISDGPAEIRRIGHQRAGVISANLTGMDLGQVVDEVETFIKEIPRSPEFLIAFGGQKEEMDRALGSLIRALVLAVFLVFVVLAIQFESLVQPFVIIAAVPLAMVGVSPVLWAFGISLNVVSFIGMIVLAGIVVNNAIVLVDRINQLRARGLPVREALIEAGKARLRPILMTTVTTVLGLLPLTGVFQGIPGLEAILGTGEGAEVRVPLAVTVIAGLMTSTFLTLVVVPVIYSLVAARRPVTRYSAHDFGASTDV
jgi:HAE1 family hydrophobic/amphiphilic exporter-1